MTVSDINDLWGGYPTRQHLVPRDLTRAIEDQVRGGDLDYRTRPLSRDSLVTWDGHWGKEQPDVWLGRSPVRRNRVEIRHHPFDDDTGFPSLPRRAMDVTRPERIRRYFQDLANQVGRPTRLAVGGSGALILSGYLLQHTEEIEVVDEVPAEIRSHPAVLAELREIHRLELSCFQRRYLALGWEKRLHSQPPIGRLQIFLLDEYDVFFSKLFSIRIKDRQDLKQLAPQLDKERLVQLLKESTQPMLAAPELCERAVKNWTMLYGEPLPL